MKTSESPENLRLSRIYNDLKHGKETVKFRFVVSPPANGSLNMALDEALFNSKLKHPALPPALRVYTWKKPCVTIGYFQKYNDFAGYGMEITRRMTGGLFVLHGNDVSYAFILDDNCWPFVYDQEKTYEIIHLGIKIALESFGIKTEFVQTDNASEPNNTKGNICVQTFYPYDLSVNNKKIVGSCMRRRGRTLLVQGSIHLPKDVDRPKFYEAWETSLKSMFNIEIDKTELSAEERKDAEMLEKSIYSDLSWNKKY